jgi:hypothetical protein
VRVRPWHPLPIVLAAAAVACSAVVVSTSSASTAGVGARVLTPRQAANLALLDRFFRAYNRHDLRDALSAFAAKPGHPRYGGVTDCDYASKTSVHYHGKRGIIEWLRSRVRDRDRLAVRSVQLVGQSGANVAYRWRKSATLARLGYMRGIVPGGATKIVLTPGPVKIIGFANAGNDAACREGGVGGFTASP